MAPSGKWNEIEPKFLARAKSRITGSSMRSPYVLRLWDAPNECARRRATAVLARSVDGLLPDGLLREPRRRSRLARRLCRGHRRLPRVLGNGRQRPVDTDAATRVRRFGRGRSVVPVRSPMAGGIRSGSRPDGEARGYS